MKNELKTHYETIQGAISKNIDTIRALIKQAESLQTIVETLPASTDGGDIKEKLITEISNISSSIDKLISDTESLFNLYRDFVNRCID